MQVYITGSGMAVPEQIVTNEELAPRLGLIPEQIVKSSGIHRLRNTVRHSDHHPMRPETNAHSWDGMNGLVIKCQPSFSTSIPLVYPDISKTLICGRSRLT